MKNTIAQYLLSAPGKLLQAALRPILNGLGNLASCFPLNSAAIAITGAGTTTVSNTAAFTYIANGGLSTLAIDTVLSALAGTVAQNTFNVFCFYINLAGVMTTSMGSAGPTLNAVEFPSTPQGSVMIGFIHINPTGGAFVGGITHLDDATVIPNAVYFSPVASFDASILID